jgi:DNA-binding cell septation regulator SpoVG
LEACIEGYIRDVEDRLPKNEFEKFEVYTDFVAVNGALGVAHVDSMKMGTSAGNPYRRSKRYYIHSVPEQDGLEDAVMPSEEILSRVRQIENSYRQHNCVRPNFCAHLKDEPVTFKKAESGKTRVFTGAPFDWTIVVRKYLLSAIRVIQRNRLLFEAGPGTVAQSTQWQDIYHYLTKFGKDRIVAGDYKSFDKRMAPEFILAAFRILRHFCKRSGNYSKEDLYVIDCIANDTAFPLVDYNGDLVQFYGSNPSGHPLTVIINSLVNSLYIRYCYMTLNPDNEVKSFKDKVALMTYGDDNIMGISDDIPWMNHTTISDALLELDVTYTMANKEAESIPYIHIDDATFLKRRWRFDVNIGAYVAPLEKESIYKSLTIWVRSKAVVEQEQLISVVASAVREFFWYGKDEFIASRQTLKEILLECGYEQWIEEWVFPTYDELKDAFWEVSKKLAQE